MGVPTVGQLLLADGTPVQAGATLTQAQLTGMVYVPPSDYLPGTLVGDLRYSATAGATTAVGSVGFEHARRSTTRRWPRAARPAGPKTRRSRCR